MALYYGLCRIAAALSHRTLPHWAVITAPSHIGPHHVSFDCFEPQRVLTRIYLSCYALITWAMLSHIVCRHGSHYLGQYFIHRFAEFGSHFGSQISSSQVHGSQIITVWVFGHTERHGVRSPTRNCFYFVFRKYILLLTNNIIILSIDLQTNNE